MPRPDHLSLTGMRVLDLSRALSGPFCTQILGDLGADVVKVEPLPDGDMIRTWGPFDRGESAYYLSGNRNKRSILVNFRSPEGLALLRRMALASDVVVENFKPGTMAAMGLDPDELRAEKPELIVASISGYGSTGPMSARAGFDQIAQGHSGFMSVTGTPETGPTRVGVAIGDMTSGMWLAIGVLSAWICRQRDGKGQSVETSLLASLVGLLSVQGQRYLSLGEVAEPSGNVHPVIAPYGVFRAQDGDMNIGAATQGMWLKLCDIIGRSDLRTDGRFLNNAGRMARREELRAIIEGELARATRAEWTERFLGAQIPAGPINTIADALNDEQVRHLELVETRPHATLGDLPQLSNPLQLDGTKGDWIRRSPPLAGADTQGILADFGLSQAETDALQRGGVVAGPSASADLRAPAA
ncbi:CoA transferase [Enterovirga sp.]|uniref:CaiB/BaiF CoA transferase family protein n=1 Tax=Enterovirga sp. TaxID=2026350 RepID=UPI00260C63C5|nr:CoA transferase [Enterovirga sp.]MDB5592030.1 frc 17 [Enterovirga sp.]